MRLFQRENIIKVQAPLSGEIVEISQVEDLTFSSELLGKGIAIKPDGNRVVCPFNGTVAQMFDTGHAVSLTSNDGVELLIHVGLETVRLRGRHYKKHVSTGDTVKKGDVLMEFDRKAIAEEGFDTVTPVVVCNSMDFKASDMVTEKFVNELDDLIVITKYIRRH